ncbi:ABC transporter, ATP-binding protein [Chitinispirillum alkaliphilum]|nr:ABC transporter, ATP-binding protein [Chitinispirillum alkaliphilum]
MTTLLETTERSSNVLEMENVSFSYQNRQLFSKLDLFIPEGGIVGLLGKNGAGKSTLMKIACGLLSPVSGESRSLGVSSFVKSPLVLRDIYFLPEITHIPTMTPREYTRLYAPFYPAFSYEQFETLLKSYSLDAGTILTRMSHGQKRIFFLCFALATNVRILILDEPTNGLDIPSKGIFRTQIAEWMRADRTVIISTHQVGDVGSLLDSIIVLESGEIIFQRSVEDIKRFMAFRVNEQAGDEGEFIFEQKVPGGFGVVLKKQAGQESPLDIELLFNAILENNQKVNDCFN